MQKGMAGSCIAAGWVLDCKTGHALLGATQRADLRDVAPRVPRHQPTNVVLRCMKRFHVANTQCWCGVRPVDAMRDCWVPRCAVIWGVFVPGVDTLELRPILRGRIESPSLESKKASLVPAATCNDTLVRKPCFLEKRPRWQPILALRTQSPCQTCSCWWQLVPKCKCLGQWEQSE